MLTAKQINELEEIVREPYNGKKLFNEEVEGMFVEALQLARESVWQPISTLPKTRGRFLVCEKRGNRKPVYDFGAWCLSREAGKRNWEYEEFETDNFINPTHWRPLPQPPQQKEEV